MGDIFILADALSMLNLPKGQAMDAIDLRNGRDFLTENKKYAVVILNYIYDENSLDDFKRMGNDPTFLVSTHQSRENWRRRLTTTKAKAVLIFGCFVASEITGAYLGPLTGYQMTSHHEAHGSWWKYQLVNNQITNDINNHLENPGVSE